jgi:hypothetical protein
MCGNSASDWKTKPTPRASTGVSIDRAPSNHTSSPSAMRPESGRRRPAIAASVVLLPHPEGPKRIVIPGAASKAISSEKGSAFPPSSARVRFTRICTES